MKNEKLCKKWRFWNLKKNNKIIKIIKKNKFCMSKTKKNLKKKLSSFLGGVNYKKI